MYAHEPSVPDELQGWSMVLLPHMGSGTQETASHGALRHGKFARVLCQPALPNAIG